MRQALGVLLFPLFFRLLKNLLLKSWVKNKNPWPSTRKEKEFRMTEANRKRKAGRWHFNRKVTKWTPLPQVWHPELKKKDEKMGIDLPFFFFCWFVSYIDCSNGGEKQSDILLFALSSACSSLFFLVLWCLEIKPNWMWLNTHTHVSFANEKIIHCQLYVCGVALEPDFSIYPFSIPTSFFFILVLHWSV